MQISRLCVREEGRRKINTAQKGQEGTRVWERALLTRHWGRDLKGESQEPQRFQARTEVNDNDQCHLLWALGIS